MKRMNDSFENTRIDVKTVQTRYIALANCFCKIESRFQMMLTLELVFEFPIFLGLVWATLAFVRIQSASPTVYLPSYFYQLHVIIQIVLPSWMAHKITLQRNRLRRLLHERRLQSQADIPEMLRLLRYLDARQLEHTLWGVLPVDLQLPVGLFTLFTTYIIVIIQFTHLYD
ncbi:hypothetical protein NE865_16048 [Phthorimaea operculella]|nr:hypothetical protein NE865_16048 [Phthorimaea operculella]